MISQTLAPGLPPFRVEYCAVSPPLVDDELLRLEFSAAAPLAADPVGDLRPDLRPDLPTGGLAFTLSMPTPSSSAPAWEIWRSNRVVRRSGRRRGLIAEDGHLAVAAWTVDETRAGGIEAATAEIYRELVGVLQESGYSFPVKIWNLLSAINLGSGDGERYRRFCVARAKFFEAGGVPPAATAIGFPTASGDVSIKSPLTVFLLASKEPGVRIENPRQVPAFRYPSQYGPASPSFSRAVWMPWGQLFVSGTASIVGHQSLHSGDVAAQIVELGKNLAALVAEAESRQLVRGLQPKALRIYLRHPEHAVICARTIAAVFPTATPQLTVCGDICRSELLVEVEGLWAAGEG